MYRKAEHVTVIAPALRENLLMKAVPVDKISVIDNFVDTDFYRFQSKVTDDAPLVFLSRIDRIKGAHNAIAVAKMTGRRLIL